jgi:hypothetical protein
MSLCAGEAVQTVIVTATQREYLHSSVFVVLRFLSRLLLLIDGSIPVLARRRVQWDCFECLITSIQNTSKVMRRPNVLHVGKTLPPLHSQKRKSVRYGAEGAREPEPYQVSRGEKLEDVTH